MSKNSRHKTKGTQKILVFQQDGSGESKIQGIKKHGEDRFDIEIKSIDGPLPVVIDDPKKYLPEDIEADLVLDFFRHPDLSHDLALICRDKNIPIVASGKKLQVKETLTPPT